MVRNSLGVNYKSAALDQLSYAGVLHTKAVFRELIKRCYDRLARPQCRVAAARRRGAKVGRLHTLDRHVKSVAKFRRRGLSGETLHENQADN